jgi:hypothetical protein
MANGMTRGTTNVVAWIALIVAVVAFLFVLTTFTRDNGIGGPVVTDEETDIGQQLQQGIAFAQADVQLRLLRTQLDQEDPDLQDVAETVSNVRDTLRVPAH